MCLCLAEDVIDSCSFRDEDDDCTYHYTVDHSKDPTVKDMEVEVLKKKGEQSPALALITMMITMMINIYICFQKIVTPNESVEFALFLSYNNVCDFIMTLQIALLPASCGCSHSCCSSCCYWHSCYSAAGSTVPAAKHAVRYKHLNSSLNDSVTASVKLTLTLISPQSCLALLPCCKRGETFVLF